MDTVLDYTETFPEHLTSNTYNFLGKEKTKLAWGEKQTQELKMMMLNQLR